MGLNVQIAMANTLKLPIRSLRRVSTACYMQMRPNSLVFAVKRDDHHGPVRLILTTFEGYMLTGGIEFVNATINIDLEQLHDILNHFGPNDHMTFKIRNRNHYVMTFSVTHLNGHQTVGSLPISVRFGSDGVPLIRRGALPIDQLPPYLGQLDGLRPFMITIPAHQFMESLVTCMERDTPMTIIGMGTGVRIFVEDDQSTEVYEYQNLAVIPISCFVRFHLHLYRAMYICRACESTEYICFRTADPTIFPHLPPAITMGTLNIDQDHLDFYLPSDSVVRPHIYVYNP